MERNIHLNESEVVFMSRNIVPFEEFCQSYFGKYHGKVECRLKDDIYDAYIFGFRQAISVLSKNGVIFENPDIKEEELYDTDI